MGLGCLGREGSSQGGAGALGMGLRLSFGLGKESLKVFLRSPGPAGCGTAAHWLLPTVLAAARQIMRGGVKASRSSFRFEPGPCDC